MDRPKPIREEAPKQPAKLESSAEVDLRQALEFERVVSSIATSLAATGSDEIDEAITSGLRKLARELQFDRAFLGTLEDGNLRVTHHWFEPGLQEEQKIFHGLVNPREFALVTKSLEGETVAISSPDELPASTAEWQLMEQTGLQSTIFVPGTIGEEVVGVLVLDRFGKSDLWSESLVESLSVPVDLLFQALVGAEVRAELENRAKFEALLAELSGQLVAVGAEDLDLEIERWLEPIGRAIGVEHVVLGALSTPNDPASVAVHTWNAGIRVRPLRPEEVPWLVREIFERRRSLLVGSLDDLPREAADDRHAFESLGIRAFASVPLRCGEDIYGGISSCALSEERAWSDQHQSWLGMIGEVFANALARRHAETELRQTLGQSQQAEASLREALIQVEELKTRLEDENVILRRRIQNDSGKRRIVGESAAVQKMLEAASQVARTDSTVLILGETGTGKELLSWAIHSMSARRDRTLVRINCGTLPPTLIESELFGREKGAYTGALARQKGRFEIADGSTILLDEIAELPLELQPRLLQVLETGTFERLGSPRTLKIDVRVIAATNRDLEKAVRKGRFREDLFFRLNVFPIRIAPLRERAEDIPLLAWSFVRELSETMGKTIQSIPPRTMASLQSYSWPGNVRELRNVIERAMIRAAGPVLEVEIPLERSIEANATFEDLQRHHIVKVLQTSDWRVRGVGGAAEILGLKPTTLDYRMKKLGIRRPPRASSSS